MSNTAVNTLSRWSGEICAALAGSLITLSLAPFDYWPLGIIALALLLPLLSKVSVKRGAMRGFIFGLGAFGTGASWVYVSIHIHGNAPAPLALLLTALFVATLAAIPAIACYLYCRFVRLHKYGALLAFPALWLLNDWLRGWLFSGFPWLIIGYGHIDTPLAGWAPVIGTAGITLICAFAASSLYHAIKHKQPLILIPTVLFFITGGALNTIEWSLPKGEPAKVAMVQPNIPQQIKWQPDSFKAITELLQDMTQSVSNVDIVIWPEAAIPRLYQHSQSLVDSIQATAINNNYTLISGIPWRTDTSEDRQYHNSLISLDSKIQTYHKQNLVPFGEHMPLEFLLRGLIEFFDLPMSSFSPGPVDQSPFAIKQWNIGASICYEIAYANLIARSANNSDFFITVSNDSWFGESIGPLQHFQMARMRALENSRYLVRGTNNGISAVIDHKGQVITQGQQFTREIVTGSVQAMSGNTPFSTTGDWPVIILSLIIVISFSLRAKQSL
jgi:apolipoprotein N-acyltransferase